MPGPLVNGPSQHRAYGVFIEAAIQNMDNKQANAHIHLHKPRVCVCVFVYVNFDGQLPTRTLERASRLWRHAERP